LAVPSANERAFQVFLEQKTIKRTMLIIVFALFASLFTCSQELDNEIPKYGGLKRTPEQIQADRKFIDFMVQKFGSHDKAADDAIRRGFAFLAQADWRMAMKRFNQAWLLSPNKPEVPWGFGAALSYQGKFEESEKYFQEAVALAPKNGKLLTDFGFLHQVWATKGTKAKNQRERRLNRSIELFEQAAQLEPVDERTYFNWAVSLFFKKDYAEAWTKIKEAEKLGGNTIDPKFIADLTKKMRRP
jgi:tetratricopeptide (TPR) repeat protein